MPNSSQFSREHLHLPGRDGIAHRLVDVGGRDVVVHRRDCEIGAPNRPTREAQPVERLGRRDLVHEVEVDVEQVGLAVGAVDDVALPHLLGERSWLRQCLRRRPGHGAIVPAGGDDGPNPGQ